MKIKFADLWRPSGTVGRGTYGLLGLLLFALKHNLDRATAAFVFHRVWGLTSYWVPLQEVAGITRLRTADAVFLGTMVILSLPFIWVGVVLTLKRLRSAGLPLSLVALFFIPFLNLLFFLFLCLFPERETTAPEPPGKPQKSLLARMVPDSALGSAAVALALTVPIGWIMAVVAARVLLNYGWGLFVALPFAMGFTAAMIYGIRQPRSQGGCVWVACLSVVLLGGVLLAVAFEGLVCLIMAAPIALPVAAFGGDIAYWIQRRRWLQNDAPAFLAVLLIFVPGVEWTEHRIAAPSPTFAVRSALDINAPPEQVWKQVVAFSQIPPPKEFLFRAGIAYPIRAEILGTGAGAERHCVFSTGAFVEPIKVWDEPRRLAFSVTSNPPPMEEWTPYSHIEPPHLHGFLVSNGGQFLLTPLPNGGTRLEGTTWYHHGLWPAAYWRLWSDPIIHQIHMRVLTHIREQAERTTN